MANRRMLLTSVALSTGLLLVGEGCMSAAPRGATTAIATTTTTTATTTKMATESETPTVAETNVAATQTALAKEEPIGTRHAIVVDAMRGCRMMNAQAGNTKGPSYTDVCVR